MMFLPVLGFIDWIVIVNRRLLFNNFTLGAGASHGGTQEYVNQEHDKEKHTKGNTKPGQPGTIASS